MLSSSGFSGSILFYFIFLLAFSSFMGVLGIYIGKKSRIIFGKKTSFECGFDQLSVPRVIFSVHFYHFGLLFLIFDVELLLLTPFILGLSFSLSAVKSVEVLMWLSFFLVLIIGLVHEYREGTLEWKI
nr:NADH dehydrogenase subunit 3 [Mytilopsis leucophaeata]